MRACSDDRQVIVEVADTGDRVPEGVDIWAPFVTTKSLGTGLGLLAVQNIVMAHQGAIDCTSELGKGKTFRLKLAFFASCHITSR